MKINRIDQLQAKRTATTTQNFEGEIGIQPLVGPADSDELDLLYVYFSAGARNKPHVHQQDQELHIIEGEGIVADEREKRDESVPKKRCQKLTNAYICSILLL